ncbi:hypothetical protein DKT77_10505 [Meridianimarinicoccus roseus]|jgi:hypothetical protein|uniref:Uncharacterized protein n=1 Tax=Meridianimarinicoccus roseus TaxID=2072018 RepID=A0A2V2LJU6_9RHOB|nr:hypothetical protein [Meridianimarinicoccus roseus]PWR02609.1 hypothetical protein DKT77_10505 [Meridianimarinicoccus roseus]
MKQTGHRSTGDMISTVVFAGMALILGSEAASGTGPVWRDALLGLTALASLLGALRFPLAALTARLRGDEDT